MLSLNCKNVQHVKIYKKVPQLKMSDNCEELFQIYFKIAGYVDLAVLIIFTPCQITDIINGFWVVTHKHAISLNCKNVQHVKIYIPCIFKVNPITHFGVIVLFWSNFQNFNTKIAGYVDLAVLIIFTPCQITDIINGFWVVTHKHAILPYVLFLVTAAILNGGQGCRTQYWKGTIQGPSQLNLF
jgi:plasmid maintenance system antidote protein VapI